MANWTNNIYVNSLLVGTRFSDTTLTYYLDHSGGFWTFDEANAVANAFDAWESVSNLSVSRTFSQFNADFLESQYTSTVRGSLGFHSYVPNPNGSTITEHNYALSGQFNDNGYGWDSAGLDVGGLGYATILHELGHGLGLDHTHADDSSDPHFFPGTNGPFLSDTGDFGLNQEVFSVMSYLGGDYALWIDGSQGADGYGHMGGPMAFDIAAIQYLYGADTNANAGNTVYTLPDSNETGTYYSAIWDTGGTDEIVYNGIWSSYIDLRSATLQGEIGGGGFVSKSIGIFGGFTIAGDFTDALSDVDGETGVIIENATGGSGNDRLIGNKTDNVLKGRGGNDVFKAGDGSDVQEGGAGDDKFFHLSGENIADQDTFDGGADYDTILFAGNSGTRYHNVRNDVLNSIEELDFGSSSSTADDRVVYIEVSQLLSDSMTPGKTIIDGYNRTGFTEALRVYMSSETSFNADAELEFNNWGQQGETLTIVDSNRSSNMTGTDYNDVIQGRGGDDTLRGGDGSDVQEGGSGDDKFFHLSGENLADIDIFKGGSGTDEILLAGNSGARRHNLRSDELDSIEEIRFGSSSSTSIDRTLYIEASQLQASAMGSNPTLIDGNDKSGFTEAVRIYMGSVQSFNAGEELEFVDWGGQGEKLTIIDSNRDSNISGTLEKDTIQGRGGNDVINGGANDDKLEGGTGNDTLTGGSGHDDFVFNTTLDDESNVDIITDFTAGFDQIILDDNIFASLGSSISSSEFQISTTANDSDDFLIYNQSTGELFYDADGSGGTNQILFAELEDNTILSFSDFDLT